MQIEHINGGVLYTDDNGNTISFAGEYAEGDVEVNGELHAFYTRDDDGVTHLHDADGKEFATIAEGEAAYEAYVQQVLAAL